MNTAELEALRAIKTIEQLAEHLDSVALELRAKAITSGKLKPVVLAHALCEDGSYGNVTVDASPIGEYFAVHRTHNDNKGWTVTHVLSGLSAKAGLPTKRVAMVMAAAMEAIGGTFWNSKEPLSNMPEREHRTIHDVSRRNDVESIADILKEYESPEENR